MKKLLLSFFALSALFANSQQSNQTISINGVTRSYIQYLPTGYNSATESLPVVFVLHGLGGTAASMTGAGLSQIADTARFIVVYPQGLNNMLGQASWNNGTQYLSSTANDELLFSTLMDNYITDFNANISRIYVTGFSMGSIMSHHLACILNNRIAAIGAMAGPMATSDITYYSANPLGYKTPVIHLHGTADGTVPYDSGALPSLSLVPETMAFWRAQHGCSSTSDSIRKPDTANDGITVDQFVYNDCNEDGAVELWRFNGADHIYLYEPVNDITEAIEIWKFFSKWQHTNASPVGIGELNAQTVKVYPNPSNGMLTIEGLSNSKIQLIKINGTIVGEFLTDAQGSLNLSQMGAGIYLIQNEKFDKPVRIVIQ